VSLRDWLGNGWLVEHTTSPQETTDLLGVCDRDLRDCKAAGISADWRFAIAYNAALQAAIAALAVAGYRAARDAHHYRCIESLAHTIGADASLVRRLDACRKKRNIGGYESAGRISDREATEMATLAVDLRARVEKWIRATRPDLLVGG
jgi:hypothetical protein